MEKWKNIPFIITQQILYMKIKNYFKLKQSLNINILALNILRLPNTSSKNHTINYGSGLKFEQIIKKADKLYEECKYIEAYNFLQLHKQFGHEIIWRLSRIIYRMSLDNNICESRKIILIDKALSTLSNTSLDLNNPNFYKWKAILLSSKYKYVNNSQKAHLLTVIQTCLLDAYRLNPDDFVVLYMLGHICFHLAKFTWFQKKILTSFYGASLTSTNEDAFYYLSKAEDIRPNQTTMKHIYLLGILALQLKKYYWAQYYFRMTTNMPVVEEEQDLDFKTEAKKLLKDLEKYDLRYRAFEF